MTYSFYLHSYPVKSSSTSCRLAWTGMTCLGINFKWIKLNFIKSSLWLLLTIIELILIWDEHYLLDDFRSCCFDSNQLCLYFSGRTSEGEHSGKMGEIAWSCQTKKGWVFYQSLQEQWLQLRYLCPRRGYPSHRLALTIERRFFYDTV